MSTAIEHVEVETGGAVTQRTTEYQPPKSWRTWLIGRPLSTADAPHQAIGKLIGLAVFSSDALSSTAYATQEMLGILILAGTAAFGYAFPLFLGIVALLAIITLSYEQTIHAYPNGGGAYIVARDNLGELPAQVAGAALLTDYILTVAVSVSSGIAQIVSAFPTLFPYRVELSVLLVAFVMIMNLRGLRESGRAFAVPTYFFLLMMFLTLITGLVRYLAGTLGTVIDPPHVEMPAVPHALTAFLLLRAFSNGTTALTGVEAIANGIPAFKEPRSRNAGITLMWMSSILATALLGITFLAIQIGAMPSEVETVISQIARTTFGSRNVLYLATMGATTLILLMATNTSFNGFPRLSAILALDGFLPRQLAFRGSRLVYSRGIVALAVIASLLIIIFRASVTALIPLYAIGVFMTFTLSQVGMARRWWKSGRLELGKHLQELGSVLHYDRLWQPKMIVNGIGAVSTAVVALVFAVTKFVDGAWMVIILIPLLVAAFSAIHRHYRNLARDLSLEKGGAPPRVTRQRVIMPIGGVHRGTLEALRYAMAISDDVTAVHVSLDPADAEKIRAKWETWGGGVRLVILDSPYRLLLEPLLKYIEDVAKERQSKEIITIVVPHFVPKRFWTNLLHTQTATMLRLALLFKPGIVITDVPYQVD